MNALHDHKNTITAGYDPTTPNRKPYLSTDILSLTSYTWREGPPLTAFRRAAPSVPLGDTFLIVGGIEYSGHGNEQTGTTLHDNILEYVPGEDAGVTRPEKLKRPKGGMHASIVD